ncbi:DUF4153 domain-containing protein, partial [Nocardia takedensis]
APTAAGGAPTAAGGAPTAAGAEPTATGAEPTATGAEPTAVGAAPTATVATVGAVPSATVPGSPDATVATPAGAPASRPLSDPAAARTDPVPAPGPLPPTYIAPPRATPRWRRIPCPPGVLPTAAVSGVAAAALVQPDRPGIGWLLAAGVTAAAVYTVDRRARTSAAQSATSDAPPASSLEVDGFTAGEKGGAPEESGPSTAEPLAPGEPTATTDRPANPDDSAPSVGGRGAVPRFRVPANVERIWWVASTFALLAVGSVRAAGWLFALCVLAAAVTGSLAVVGRRSIWGAWHDVIAVPFAVTVAVPWACVGAGRARESERGRRIGWSVVVTVAMLAVFVPLLAGGDAAFSALLDEVLPTVDEPAVVRWIALFVVAGSGAIAALFLLAGPLPPAGAPRVRRSLRRAEWAIPVGALTVLFAVFVAVQFVTLFGGDDYVLRTIDLTYAEYAREGFWQLATVSVLTLLVILGVLRWANREDAADRVWLRVLTTAVSVLSLVIVASALGRMWTYQEAYGFTVMRLLVGTCELWLGGVFLLVLAGLVRLDVTWLPRAALGTAFTTLFALACLNPEGIVADRNVDRWYEGRSLDTYYLQNLSPDIFDALDRLPDEESRIVRNAILRDQPEDSWNSWNLSRSRTR